MAGDRPCEVSDRARTTHPRHIADLFPACSYAGVMIWVQGRITLAPRPRGFHLITRDILDGIDGLGQIRVGLLHLLIQHTSASLTLNENASPDVRRDFESWFDDAVPERAPFWTHTLEGSDDMPAHIKASLLGRR